MNHKLEIQITTDTDASIGKLNPCESYAAQLLADAKAGFQKYRWEAIPCDERPYSPTFKITDDAAGLVTEVSRTDNTGKLVRYTMSTTAADGGVIYSAMEMAPGVGDGQGCLACCDSWGCKESDTTERLN